MESGKEAAVFGSLLCAFVYCQGFLSIEVVEERVSFPNGNRSWWGRIVFPLDQLQGFIKLSFVHGNGYHVHAHNRYR